MNDVVPPNVERLRLRQLNIEMDPQGPLVRKVVKTQRRDGDVGPNRIGILPEDPLLDSSLQKGLQRCDKWRIEATENVGALELFRLVQIHCPHQADQIRMLTVISPVEQRELGYALNGIERIHFECGLGRP